MKRKKSDSSTRANAWSLILFGLLGIGFARALTTSSSGRSVQALGKPLHWQVAWTHSLVKLPPAKTRAETYRTDAVAVSLAKGESESFQLLLTANVPWVPLGVTISPLMHGNGVDHFAAEDVTIRKVGYVTTRRPYYAAAYVGAWPDPLIAADNFLVYAGQLQPVWVTVTAPAAIAAGDYAASITVTDETGAVVCLPLDVHVWDFTLPKKPALQSAFGLYRNRLVEAYRHFVPGGRRWLNHLDTLTQIYEYQLLRQRLSPMVDFDPFAEGSHQRLDSALKSGLTAFALGPWGGNDDNQWPTDAETVFLRKAWYQKAAQVVRERSVLPLSYVYAYDEPKLNDPHVAAALRLIKEADPALRTLVVLHRALDFDADSVWLNDTDIVCLRLASFDRAVAQKLKQMGKEVWLYVSSPAAGFPGLVIDEPAINHRWLARLCWKYEAQGFLYWCANYWRANPWLTPATFANDQNGNGFLFYPAPGGPVASLRLEVLRDGMEDYDYLMQLRQLVEGVHRHKHADSLLAAEAEKLLSMAEEWQNPQQLLAHRQALGECIEKLKQQTGQGT